MHPLQLDYLTRHWSSYRAGAAVLIAAAVASIYVLTLHVLTGIEIKSQEKQWQSSQRRDNTGNSASNGSPEKIERLKPELKRANEIVQQLATPWDGLFNAIEVFDPNQVALLRIETDMSRHSLTITAEAKSFNGMLGYLRSLGKQAQLTDVYLISHQLLTEDELKPVRFSISANWTVEPSTK